MSYDQYTADLLRENATLRTALAMHVRSLAALLDTNAVADEFANNVDPEWFGLLERIESLRDQMEVEEVVTNDLRTALADARRENNAMAAVVEAAFVEGQSSMHSTYDFAGVEANYEWDHSDAKAALDAHRAYRAKEKNDPSS